MVQARRLRLPPHHRRSVRRRYPHEDGLLPPLRLRMRPCGKPVVELLKGDLTRLRAPSSPR